MKLRGLLGWRTDQLDRGKLRLAVLSVTEVEPLVEQVAIRLIAGLPLTDKEWTLNTERYYKVRARRLLEEILLADPEGFGLVRIDPESINRTMTTSELAEFCDVQVYKVRVLARGAPDNGLPKAEWPLGRMLKGRGWRFPPEIAREYARRLLEID